jgi:hypothetical protein
VPWSHGLRLSELPVSELVDGPLQPIASDIATTIPPPSPKSAGRIALTHSDTAASAPDGAYSSAVQTTTRRASLSPVAMGAGEMTGHGSIEVERERGSGVICPDVCVPVAAGCAAMSVSPGDDTVLQGDTSTKVRLPTERECCWRGWQLRPILGAAGRRESCELRGAANDSSARRSAMPPRLPALARASNVALWVDIVRRESLSPSRWP